MPERRGCGEGGNSEVWSTNPYRGISHCQGIYKRIRIAHTILMESLTRPIRNVRKLTLSSRLTLMGCRFWHDLANTSVNYTIVLFVTLSFKINVVSDAVLHFPAIPLWGTFLTAGKKKNNSEIYRCVRQCCLKWQDVKVGQLINFKWPPFWIRLSNRPLVCVNIVVLKMPQQ